MLVWLLNLRIPSPHPSPYQLPSYAHQPQARHPATCPVLGIAQPLAQWLTRRQTERTVLFAPRPGGPAPCRARHFDSAPFLDWHLSLSHPRALQRLLQGTTCLVLQHNPSNNDEHSGRALLKSLLSDRRIGVSDALQHRFPPTEFWAGAEATAL